MLYWIARSVRYHFDRTSNSDSKDHLQSCSVDAYCPGCVVCDDRRKNIDSSHEDLPILKDSMCDIVFSGERAMNTHQSNN